MEKSFLDDMKVIIGERIRKGRESKRLSQPELAEKAGVSKALISFYERGLRKPDIEKLIRIANALDVHPAEIIPVQDDDLCKQLEILETSYTLNFIKELKELSPERKRRILSYVWFEIEEQHKEQEELKEHKLEQLDEETSIKAFGKELLNNVRFNQINEEDYSDYLEAQIKQLEETDE
jgi:transcriptional regulator with XRE-family HTH domain